MSILNVWLASDHALVGVDTEGVSPEGQRHEVSKMLPIPHINAVLAGRGSLALLGCVFVQLLVTDIGDFDALADRLLAAVKQAFAGTIGGPLREVEPSLYQAGDEIVLVGWSPRLRRMRAVEVLREPGAPTFSIEDTELRYVAPWHESIADAPNPSDVWNMRTLVRAQCALIKKEFPAGAAGGHLVFAEIRQGRMSIAAVGI